MNTFSKDGRMIIPIGKRVKKEEEKVRYVITEAYCPGGCKIMDDGYRFQGYPGIRMKYKRPGVEGEFVISPIEGDFSKIIISGDLIDGIKDELY